MKHTTEPWMAWKDGSDRDLFGPATNYTAGQCFHTPDIDACEANARRIVACVNACAGVTTEELEQGGFVAGLIEQRDALAEELRNIRDAKLREFDDDPRRCASQFVAWAQNRARYTIEKVGAGTTATEGHNV